MSGRFITIEGGEGAGKSTAQGYIAEKLEQQGLSVVCTREPGGTPLAEAIRHMLLALDGEAPWKWRNYCLFAARAHHKSDRASAGKGAVGNLRSLHRRHLCISGAARGLPLEAISKLARLVQGERRPHAVVLMDSLGNWYGEGACPRALIVLNKRILPFTIASERLSESGKALPAQYSIVDAVNGSTQCGAGEPAN